MLRTMITDNRVIYSISQESARNESLFFLPPALQTS